MATWLTGAQAIKHMNVARATFYKLVKEGKVTPYYLPGIADPRYKQEELDDLFVPGTNSATEAQEKKLTDR